MVKHLDLAVGCALDPLTPEAPAADATTAPEFELSSWRVRYPWSESDFGFSSSDSMLTKVYDLCANTLRVTSLDTTTDSNTRERLPCEKQCPLSKVRADLLWVSDEADGFITGNSRYMFQREYHWQLHSARHQFLNPTWYLRHGTHFIVVAASLI